MVTSHYYLSDFYLPSRICFLCISARSFGINNPLKKGYAMLHTISLTALWAHHGAASSVLDTAVETIAGFSHAMYLLKYNVFTPERVIHPV